LSEVAKATVLAVLLGSCTVGPNFVRPYTDAPGRWWGAAPAANTSSTIVFGGEVDTAWWGRFQDPELSSLVSRLAGQNLDLQEAAERVQQGEAQRQIVASRGLPHLATDGSYARTRDSPTGLISLFQSAPNAQLNFDIWQNSLSASWELDLFGRVRRAVEAERANTEAAIEARHGVAIMAIADLAQDYVQLRGTQDLVAIALANLANSQHNTRLVRARFANGVSTTLDIANAEAQTATIESTLPPLRTEEARLINAIGLLLAQPPGAVEAELLSRSGQTLIPPKVEVGLPGELARRRPDVREAEARLHAATAESGVAVASFYPDVTLMANGGMQSLQFADTFNLNSAFYSVGPSIDLPIFEGSRLRGRLHLRNSQERQAAIEYRATVLRAWQEADNALTAYEQAQGRAVKVKEAVKQNEMALAAARQRYAEGVVDFLNVIAAEDAVLKSQNALASTRTQIAIDLVGIYKSLGGGWEIADAK
jgi:NodT family efflux transporter outer membrane factor (OMF) lipoprotein